MFKASVLATLRTKLLVKEKQLLKRKEELMKEDPFQDPDRLNDNAAIDTDAAEQFGHANVAAMVKEVDKMLIRIRKTLTRMKIGKYGICDNCGKMIDTQRLAINPTAQYCINCESQR